MHSFDAKHTLKPEERKMLLQKLRRKKDKHRECDASDANCSHRSAALSVKNKDPITAMLQLGIDEPEILFNANTIITNAQRMKTITQARSTTSGKKHEETDYSDEQPPVAWKAETLDDTNKFL
eukprot:6193519-Pleurochrysis_carterae.AAC.6